MSHRHVSYKSPPIEVKNVRESQRQRRDRALKEQKQKRLQKVESSRQLDLFSELSLGVSDDEADNEVNVVSEGIGQYKSLLEPSDSTASNTPVTIGFTNKGDSSSRISRRTKKANRWANKCMYAELLEMHGGTSGDFSGTSDIKLEDGLPDDLETNYIAVGPVPVGKRCLLVTQQSSGVWGSVPNTVLRSRVMGKAITPPFPSTFPPSSVLDCILDESWKTNGLLHILDVIRWKGQNIAECEASFRFWWRDTRLSEVPKTSSFVARQSQSSVDSAVWKFKFPINFEPIPYSSDTKYETFITDVIPHATVSRPLSIVVPKIETINNDKATLDDMEIDKSLDGDGSLELIPVVINLRSDGILLYVAQASYEPGNSPLSNWVPLLNFADRTETDSNTQLETIMTMDSPLALFKRLIMARIERKNKNTHFEFIDNNVMHE